TPTGREAPDMSASGRASCAGDDADSIADAALRTTVEETVTHEGRVLDAVRGRLLATGREATFYAGDLPQNPAEILSPARQGATGWLDADYRVMSFAPARLNLKPGEGPPHIRLDRAAERS